MLRALKEVRADDSAVGFYQSTTMGAFFSQTLVDTQAIHQEKIRHGGVVIVHGTTLFSLFTGAEIDGVRITVDVSQTNRGNASFRAFRLSKEFLDAYRKPPFSAKSWVVGFISQALILIFNLIHLISMINHKLTFNSIMEEVPLKIRTNPLLSAFVSTLSEHRPTTPTQPLPSEVYSTSLPHLYSTLDLGNPTLTKNLENVIEAVDNYKLEEGNLAYHTRQIAREKTRAEAFVTKRKEENANRTAQGLAPLPEEDISRIFKIPPEPSRLESMLLLGQVDAYAKTLEGTSSLSLVKMYSARAGTDANREVFQ
jgi:translation initiation factor 3 subunit H